MIVSFRATNFRSFLNEAMLSMRPIQAYREFGENIATVGKVKLLKTAAIYGANASGKSNVVKAIGAMRRIVLRSARLSSVDKLSVEPFALNADSVEKPTRFEMSMLISGRIVRYGFAVTKDAVVAEWLGLSSGGPRAIERMLLIRDKDRLERSSVRYFPELSKFDMGTLLSNSLLLPRLDQLNNKFAKSVMKWFKDLTVLSGSQSSEYDEYSTRHFNDATFHDRMMGFLRFADSGIESAAVQSHEIGLKDLPDSVRKRFSTQFNSDVQVTVNARQVLVSRTNRQGTMIPFDLEDRESEGTIKMFELSGPLTDILNQGSVLVIDELEAKLHPMLTRRILRVFNSPIRNPRCAQILFVTHDATLLRQGRLRRDQVWFCEKNRHHESELFCLAEVKATARARREDNLEKKYLEGRFGAIPTFPVEEF